MNNLLISQAVEWFAANDSWIQIISMICGVTYMTLQIFQKRIMWYFSIAASVAAIIVSSTNLENGAWAPLWAQVILNAYLITMAIVGIFRWRTLEGESGGKLHIVPLSRGRIIFVAVAVAVGVPLVSWLLTFTHDPAPFLDGTSLVLSLVAAYLLSQSHIEQYLFWIVANALIIVVFATQAKWFMVAMYSFYIVTCILGFINWKKNGVIVEE